MSALSYSLDLASNNDFNYEFSLIVKSISAPTYISTFISAPTYISTFISARTYISTFISAPTYISTFLEKESYKIIMLQHIKIKQNDVAVPEETQTHNSVKSQRACRKN